MPLNVLFRLQICIDTIERNIREAILLSIIAHGETEAYEGRIVGESGFERLGLQVLWILTPVIAPMVRMIRLMS